MKTFLVIFLMTAIIVYVQGANSCRGRSDKTYCPDKTESITVEKKTRKDDNNIMDITVTCKDSSDIVIASCSDTTTNPFPGVQINSYQFTGSYTNKKHVHKNTHTDVATSSNDFDDVETLD